MADNQASLNTIRMPGTAQDTAGGNRHLGTELGNPKGDQVDNSAGANVAANKHVQSLSTGAGAGLSSMSRPSWLYQ